MKAMITIKLCPESREELIASFGVQYRDFREQVEQATAQQGICGLSPDKIQFRWLLESGKWHIPVEGGA